MLQQTLGLKGRVPQYRRHDQESVPLGRRTSTSTRWLVGNESAIAKRSCQACRVQEDTCQEPVHPVLQGVRCLSEGVALRGYAQSADSER